MSELVALSFDADTSPSVKFQPPGRSDSAFDPCGSAEIYGWGVSWYPSSERGAMVIKDPASSGERTVSGALGDWHRFRSTAFICHLRGHQRPRSQADAQPFVRSYGGRHWVFAHDGDLAPDYAVRFPLADDPALEPLGRTDSEHAFCWLLARMHARRARSLEDISPEELRAWLMELNGGGEFNALLTDGENLAVYHDIAQYRNLYWTRRIPPHATTHLESDAIRIELDAPEDSNRTALLFSSTPLSSDNWLSLASSELILARRGSVIWRSEPFGQIQTAAAPFASGDLVEAGHIETGHQAAMVEPLPNAGGGYSHPAQSTSRTLSIVHETTYRYERPVERSSHRFLLRPVEDRYQALLEHSVEIRQAVDRSEYEDVFGNAALAVEIGQPYSELQITSRATVRVVTPHSLERRAARRRNAIPLVWMPWQRQMLAAYLLPPELPESQLNELFDFAMSFVERNDYDLVGTLLDLNDTLYRDFEYVSGSTDNETTPFQVFESRRGVCQDFANLMICLARLLHVPARYRMGYIFTGADYENKIQSEASHAWVETYLPRVGWHGFDPTNGRQVGSEHIRVACGRNFRDATPTSGTIYQGGGTETLIVSVRVEEVGETSR